MTRSKARTSAALLALCLLIPTSACPAQEEAQPAAGGAAKADKMLVYVGTYTGRSGSKGIYVMPLDVKSGKLGEPEVAAEVTSPSFLAFHPSRKFLYAVGEVDDFQGKKGGGVSAFSIDPATGKLTLLNQQSSGGAGPCFVSTDAAGKHAFVANYGGGSVACLPIESDGKLREASSFVQHQGSGATPRQKDPHAHSIQPDPTGKFVMAADLGLDKLLVYRFDPAAGKLEPNDPPAGVLSPGSGPRHFAFHPNGKFAFVINEIKCTVTAFAYDAGRGTLTEVHTLSTLPEGFTGNNLSTAEIVVHPSGKFVYGSNRGHDSIASFSIDAQTGKLTPTGHEPTGGKTPRNFNIDPTGTWLLAANQNSGTVVVFRIDPATGKLTPTGTMARVAAPVCIKFLPVGK